MNNRVMHGINMLSVWSGLLFAFLTCVGFILLARFLPPPSPAMSAEQVVAIYQSNATGIRAGAVVMMWAAALFIPFTALITQYIIRIEGRVGVLSIMQILGGFAAALLFFYPCLWWLTASFRLERDPQIVLMLHDTAWLQFLGALSLFLIQLLSIAVVAFFDESEKPVFPRWAGYYNIFVLLAISPNQLLFFFKTGPFAWNGVFGWWIPAIDFFVWIGVMFFLLRKAVMNDALRDGGKPDLTAIHASQIPASQMR